MDLFQPRKQELYKSLAVRNNAIQTLVDRGFRISEGIFKLSLEDFEKIREKELHHIFFSELVNIDGSEYKDGGVLLYFEASDKMDKKTLQQLLQRLEKEYPKLDKLFIVLQQGIKKRKINFNVLDELKNYPYVEILDNVFPFSITKNVIMPTFVKLTLEEKEKVVEIIGTQLPKMILTDPIAARYGAKVGDILKVVRNGGLDISYRIISEPVIL